VIFVGWAFGVVGWVLHRREVTKSFREKGWSGLPRFRGYLV